MRVIVVDTEIRYSVGGSLFRAFRALGHEASFFEQGRFVAGWASASRAERIARTAARPLAIPAMNLALLSEVLAQRPDLVVVMKGQDILPETVTAMRRGAEFVVVWHPDDLENPLNTNDRMRKAVPLWDVIFTPRTFALNEIRMRGGWRVEHLPFGWDPTLSHPAPEGAIPEAGIAEAVTFAGAWAPERVALLETLAGQVPLKVWGGGWERVPKTSPLFPSLHPYHLLDDGLRALLTHSAINLSLLRKGNRDQHQMRSFEVPATGGFMLAERSDEHRAMYVEGEEAVFFDGPMELLAQVRRYLPDREARLRIAAAGRRRLLAGRHTYRDRAARIVEVISKLL